jgi:hypothetical protein
MIRRVVSITPWISIWSNVLCTLAQDIASNARMFIGPKSAVVQVTWVNERVQGCRCHKSIARCQKSQLANAAVATPQLNQSTRQDKRDTLRALHLPE